MNCCDEYGNCRQGRDCPAREAMPVDVYDKLIVWIEAALFIAVIGMALIAWSMWK